MNCEHNNILAHICDDEITAQNLKGLNFMWSFFSSRKDELTIQILVIYSELRSELKDQLIVQNSADPCYLVNWRWKWTCFYLVFLFLFILHFHYIFNHNLSPGTTWQIRRPRPMSTLVSCVAMSTQRGAIYSNIWGRSITLT